MALRRRWTGGIIAWLLAVAGCGASHQVTEVDAPASHAWRPARKASHVPAQRPAGEAACSTATSGEVMVCGAKLSMGMSSGALAGDLTLDSIILGENYVFPRLSPSELSAAAVHHMRTGGLSRCPDAIEHSQGDPSLVLHLRDSCEVVRQAELRGDVRVTFAEDLGKQTVVVELSNFHVGSVQVEGKASFDTTDGRTLSANAGSVFHITDTASPAASRNATRPGPGSERQSRSQILAQRYSSQKENILFRVLFPLSWLWFYH